MGRTSFALVLAGVLAGCSSSIPPADKSDTLPPPDNCVEGGSCMTGEPGACAVGRLVCVHGVAQCAAPARPAFETCFNGIDDNCDGLIDNGCPVSVHIGPPRALSVHGGTGGGTGAVGCPPNSFVSQTQLWRDDGDQEMAGVTISCATPSLVKGDIRYDLTFTPVLNPGTATTIKGSKATGVDPNPKYICPDGTVSWYLNGTVGSEFVDGLGAGCAWAAVNLLDANVLDIQFQRIDNGGADSYHATTAFEDRCAADEAVIGYNVRYGSWLDSIQPICAPIVVTYDE
jgi:hypothetical protein